MPQRSNVLCVNEAQEQADYMDAVSTIIRRILNDHDETLVGIAERINVTVLTVSNAFNKKSCLNPIYLKRLGQVFGPRALDPYLALIGGRVIPLEESAGADILPLILTAGQKVAQARDPDSPGGVRETLNERLGYLPELRRLRYELGAQIATIEAEAA